MKISLYLLVLAGALFITPLEAQHRAYTAADHVQLHMPASPVISPDAKQIAFTMRSADLVNSKWLTQVYLLSVAERTVRTMTTSVAGSREPRWSPDSKTLSFVSSREFLDDSLRKHAGTPQLFMLSMDGGEAVPMTTLENGVDEYSWSPDGTSIAILSEEELSPEKQAEAEAKAKLKMDWTSSLDVKPGKDLWMLNPASKKIHKIATLDRGVENLSWSPDGTRLVYQTNYTGEYNDEQKFDLWEIDVNGAKTQLTKTVGPETRPQFSPDGKSIAFITQTVPDIEFAKTELSVMNADGTQRRSLTASFPYSVTSFVWEPDGKSLVGLVSEKTAPCAYRIPVEKGAAEKLPNSGGAVLSDLCIAHDGTLACGIETATTTKELGVIKKNELAALSNFSAQLAPFSFGRQEVITVKSRDGKFDIDAILVKPVNYEAGKRYPLLLAYHGGPYGEYDNKLYQYYPVQLLAQEGVMTVMPNVRGGSGYTDAFSQANRYDLGGADFRDAMDVVDHLIAEGLVDSTKMGVTGGSYGGYMTNWTISQTPRFKAAVSMYGIFSWFTDWSNSFQPSFEQMYFGYNYWDKPLDMNNLWIRTAPQTYVRNIVTPTLILQGTEDVYTNISNSREMYAALKELGRTVEFVVYPRAEHGLRTEPNQYLNVLERSVRWFNTYALGEK
jgi:dipeptidyl aminopeptidase/acylaminoacyl peptidase